MAARDLYLTEARSLLGRMERDRTGLPDEVFVWAAAEIGDLFSSAADAKAEEIREREADCPVSDEQGT